jgi:hypothetical protein
VGRCLAVRAKHSRKTAASPHLERCLLLPSSCAVSRWQINQTVTTPALTQAVCSFIPRQLSVAGATPCVLFFHGLSGLENACDDGVVQQ